MDCQVEVGVLSVVKMTVQRLLPAEAVIVLSTMRIQSHTQLATSNQSLLLLLLQLKMLPLLQKGMHMFNS
jgi:hypothetical protein